MEASFHIFFYVKRRGDQFCVEREGKSGRKPALARYERSEFNTYSAPQRVYQPDLTGSGAQN